MHSFHVDEKDIE